ncbi:RNA polymerase subunit sigma [Streptomyces sp. NPDC001982]|uniref:RNA polymerase subunit sigma n=1 Tax=unclassified Streptomyces TaxID=2593676 RepID=UPI003327C76B
MDHRDAVPIAELLDERRYLLDVAHGMLRSPSAAESVVDRTYRRWYALSDAARGRIAVPRTWLARTAVEVCLDRLAVSDGGAAGGGEKACRVVLNEVFETAPTTPLEHDALARAVRDACMREDAVLLVSLLRPDVMAFFDGGGKVRTLVGPVHGSRQVARSLLTLLARRPRSTLTARSVNGRTGLVARYDDQVAAVICLDIADHHVAHIWAVLNPDKLRLWNQPHSRVAPA